MVWCRSGLVPQCQRRSAGTVERHKPDFSGWAPGRSVLSTVGRTVLVTMVHVGNVRAVMALLGMAMVMRVPTSCARGARVKTGVDDHLVVHVIMIRVGVPVLVGVQQRLMLVGVPMRREQR